LGHSATPRFPSSLIEPDVPISGIRPSFNGHMTLSDSRQKPPPVATLRPLAVTTVVPLPTNLHVSFQAGSSGYGVVVTPNQNCSAAVTSTGFSVVLTPPSGVTLAAGSFDCLIVG
jgi:hypothetical protein